MGVLSALQDAVVSLGARGIGRMSSDFRDRVARQMATHWLSGDARYARTLHGNLRLAFPERNEQALRDLAELNARRTARAQIDHFWAWHASPEALRETVSLQGHAQLKDGMPTVLAGAHQLGFEVALIRMSMEVSGALVFDPGATPLPRAAQRAWSRFQPQQVIAAEGALRPARAAVRSGKPLLLLADEPAEGQHAEVAPLLGTTMRFTPLVSFLARACAARVVWLDVRQSDSGNYRATLSEPFAANEMAEPAASAQAMAARLERALRVDPAGYWWGRKTVGGVRPVRAEQIGTKGGAMGADQSQGSGSVRAGG